MPLEPVGERCSEPLGGDMPGMRRDELRRASNALPQGCKGGRFARQEAIAIGAAERHAPGLGQRLVVILRQGQMCPGIFDGYGGIQR